MEIVNSVWHVISSVIIFFVGGAFVLSCCRIFYLKKLFALAMYIWHTIFCFVYVGYAKSNSADANRYFNSNNLDFDSFRLGTVAVEQFTSVLKVIDISYLGCFLVFNIIGTIGYMAVSASLFDATKFANKHARLLALFFIFLPSLSFWSSAIGKDAISFLSVGLALWSSLNFKSRKLLMFVSVLLMMVVRPHMAGLMIIALAMSLIFDKNIGKLTKSLLTTFTLLVAFLFIPYVLQYANISAGDGIQGVSDYITLRESHNTQGGSSVNIAGMSLPMKMFTYVFRPLPFEAHSITALMASLDNVLLLIIFFTGIRKLTHIKRSQANRYFMWFYAFGALIILSLTTANLGIAMRQKWMFLPFFAYLFISAFSQTKNKFYK